jgi:CSLREA domain-containing protein
MIFRPRVAPTLLVALLLLALPAVASAAVYEVNSTGDEPDATPGVGGCLTAGLKCTLRAAIQESNASTGVRDEITFSPEFDRQLGDTIVPGGGSNNGGGGNGGAADKTPPDTKITKAPPKKTHKTTVKFRFSATEAGSSFQCKIDGKPFKACRSPKTYKKLKPGKHVFKVRAIDKAGNVDPSPAKRKFTVLS